MNAPAHRPQCTICSALCGRRHGCFVGGLPPEPVAIDISGATTRECRMETVFRYANVFDRALDLIAAGKVDLKPLLSGTFTFEDSIAAFERAAEARPQDVKLQIRVDTESEAE